MAMAGYWANAIDEVTNRLDTELQRKMGGGL